MGKIFCLLAVSILALLSVVAARQSKAGYLAGLLAPSCSITITDPSGATITLSVSATSQSTANLQSLALDSDNDPPPSQQSSIGERSLSWTKTFTSSAPVDTVYTATAADEIGNTSTCNLANRGPWLQVVGDVHSNNGIYSTSGP